MSFYPNTKPLTLKRRPWLWIKFYYYKYIRRLDIIEFFAGVPIIRSKYLVEESKKELPK